MVYKDKAKQAEACRLAGIRYRERKKQKGYVRTWVQVTERKEEAQQEIAAKQNPEVLTATPELNKEQGVTNEQSF